MKILVACEFSGTVRDAFSALGYDATSCDLLPSETEGKHYQGDVRDILNDGWDMMIAHPPCTYLTNAGVRHLHEHVTSKNGVRAKVYGKARMEAMVESAEFFKILQNAPIPKIAIENPIPHKYAREIIGYYDQLIQPWMFGHGETKATCLWLKNLPHLKPENVVSGREQRIHKMPPSVDRWKNRSRTYKGIAKAMVNQWG
jgi:hypothetical protein